MTSSLPMRCATDCATSAYSTNESHFIISHVYLSMKIRLEFVSLFEYVLTDRGSEFGDPESLETGISEIQRCSLYYCDPMRSGQKGGVENVHNYRKTFHSIPSAGTP